MQIHPFGSHHIHIPLVVDRPPDQITLEDLIPLNQASDHIIGIWSIPSLTPKDQITLSAPCYTDVGRSDHMIRRERETERASERQWETWTGSDQIESERETARKSMETYPSICDRYDRPSFASYCNSY
eukprot:sb/3475362/